MKMKDLRIYLLAKDKKYYDARLIKPISKIEPPSKDLYHGYRRQENKFEEILNKKIEEIRKKGKSK